jgi:hypothetical protein
MRQIQRSAIVAAVLVWLLPGQASGFTYGSLVAGQVKSALAYGSGSSWCLVDNGNTLFQINQAGTKGVISFAEVIYFNGTTYYSLSGQNTLTFNTMTDGIIHFKQTPTYPPEVHLPAFTNYTETYVAATDQLIVSFNILFPTCTLPVFAVYDAP